MTPLVEELVPCPEPWEVARKLAHLPHLLFLDSADRHPERGRYSYVMADPTKWEQGRLFPPTILTSNPILDWTENMRFGVGDIFQNLSRSYRSASERERVNGLPPFQGGYAAVFGYELNHEIEDRVAQPTNDEFGAPHFAYGQYEWVVSFDHVQKRGWLIVNMEPEPSPKRRIAREKQANMLSLVAQGAKKPKPWHPERRISHLKHNEFASLHSLPDFPTVTSNFSPAGYREAVRRAVEYIHAGDCFQVNLSQRLLAPLTEHPLDLYGRLRERNPAPFACYFDAGDFQIVSASPERFLQVSPDGHVVTQPIKGTRPRGRTPEEDAALLHDLVTSPKDRAENVMIVDLLRNDLGRVCEYGSVTVPRVCDVETYRTVHHLVSEVRGKLRPGITPFDLLRAAFPGGSVTGAPKVRAMEIIAELEPTARGPYCGSVGFVGFDGAMDTNILIRTFTAGRGWLQFPVGGGVVADSDPDREYEETLHKAEGLLRALKP